MTRCADSGCPMLAVWRVTLVERDGARTVSDLCSFHERMNNTAFLLQEIAILGGRECLALALVDGPKEAA